MRLENFVQMVMDDLRGFVPEGGEVRFEVGVSAYDPVPGGPFETCVHTGGQQIFFTARMGEASPHTPESEHAKDA